MRMLAMMAALAGVGCKGVAEDLVDPDADPGVDRSTLLGEVTEDEALEFCEDVSREEMVVDCPDGPLTVPATDVPACVGSIAQYPENCDHTLADLVTCADAIDAEDPCEPLTEIPVECEFLLEPPCGAPV